MVKIITLDKDLNTVEEKEVLQRELTGECWGIQFDGLKACETCEFLNTDNCGGKNIRKTLQNAKGFPIPK